MVRIGIVGGVGPLASAHFYQRLLSLSGAERDEDYPPVVFIADRVPSRIKHLLGKGSSPLPVLVRTVLGLAAQGAGMIAIPSVTTHAYRAELSRHVTIPILDLLAVTGQVLASGGYHRPVVLATEATVKLRLLDGALGPDIQPIYPDEPTQRVVSALIERVKRDGPSDALRDELLDCVETVVLVSRGVADCVVLGCTELPVIHPTKPTSVPLIDTTDELARAVLAEFVTHQRKGPQS